jgi:hypothetical protein
MASSETRPTLDESFPRRYEVGTPTRIEGDPGLLCFPARLALSVEVKPEGRESWTGAFGEDDSSFITGLFTTPHESALCVVCGGAGYFVQTDEPESAWSPVECSPIRLVLPFPKHGLLVFGNFTGFVAYRCDPTFPSVYLIEAWRSARLGWDDLEVTQTTEDRLEGRAWHAPERRMVGFSLDARTGEHEGGAYPRERD